MALLRIQSVLLLEQLPGGSSSAAAAAAATTLCELVVMVLKCLRVTRTRFLQEFLYTGGVRPTALAMLGIFCHGYLKESRGEEIEGDLLFCPVRFSGYRSPCLCTVSKTYGTRFSLPIAQPVEICCNWPQYHKYSN
jgi:hypothetical protein